MQSRHTRIRSEDGHLVFIRSWTAENTSPVRGAILICHGMAEHSGRYSEFAVHLAEAGYAVFAHDHRGHGESIGQGLQGHYADQNGWQKVIADVRLVHQHIQTLYSQVPVALFGHSMGSFIALQYLMSHSPPINALILSGSNFSNPLRFSVAAQIAKLESVRLGKLAHSPLLRQMTFGSFNRQFEPVSTDYDWLTRDATAVENYIQDDKCGFECTTQLWIDLLSGLEQVFKSASLRKIPSALPIYIFGGSEDPVSGQGRGLDKLALKLVETGHQDVQLKLYDQGRHEMLNETNRIEVIRELLHWLEKHAALHLQLPGALAVG